MCGIIGLHLKTPDLAPRLGELLTEMLEAMTTRGPDSAGIAVYADPTPAGNEQGEERELRYSLRSDEAIDWDQLAKRIAAETGCDIRVEPLGADCVIFGSLAAESEFLAAIRRVTPHGSVPGDGRSMVGLKDVGAP